ncbi:MAG: LLM class flavin-dependent oxidoreductase [Dehalococcoidia bacterium]
MAIGIGLTNENWDEVADYVRIAERLGVDCVWSAEAWGHDAVSPLAFLAGRTEKIGLGSGILQISGRTPALAGMTAMTLTSISGGRFRLGLGASGPQVVEGWHGRPFGRTPQRLREYIEIVRMVISGRQVRYSGELFELPRSGGEGKALRTSARPTPEVPVYLATLSPKSLELTGELADGWVGTSFMPEHADVFLEPMKRGAERAGRSLEDIDLMAGGGVAFGSDIEELVAPRRKGMAFTLGAMGSRRHNFYNAAFRRAGYEDVAEEAQRLYLDGRRAEAAELIPSEMIEKTNLLGTDRMVRDRIIAYSDAGITTLRVDPAGGTLGARLDTLERFMALVKDV